MLENLLNALEFNQKAPFESLPIAFDLKPRDFNTLRQIEFEPKFVDWWGATDSQILFINGAERRTIGPVYPIMSAFVSVHWPGFAQRKPDLTLVWFCGPNKDNEARALDVMLRNLIGQIIYSIDGQQQLFPYRNLVFDLKDLISAFVFLLRNMLDKVNVLCMIDRIDYYYDYNRDDAEQFLRQLDTVAGQTHAHAFKLLVTYDKSIGLPKGLSRATFMDVPKSTAMDCGAGRLRPCVGRRYT